MSRARLSRGLDLLVLVLTLGFGLFGVRTASLSSFFLSQGQESDLARLQAEVAGLRQEVAMLVKLQAGRDALSPSPPSGERVG